jgi:hypothetical protein
MISRFGASHLFSGLCGEEIAASVSSKSSGWAQTVIRGFLNVTLTLSWLRRSEHNVAIIRCLLQAPQ